MNERVSRQGALACFCDEVTEEYGEVIESYFTVMFSGVYQEVQICKNYYEGTLNKYGLYESQMSDFMNAYLSSRGINNI